MTMTEVYLVSRATGEAPDDVLKRLLREAFAAGAVAEKDGRTACLWPGPGVLARVLRGAVIDGALPQMVDLIDSGPEMREACDARA